MTRRAARETAFKLTYEMVMTGEYNAETEAELLSAADSDAAMYVAAVTRGITAHADEIKAQIVKYAQGYEYGRIYKVDLAILYLAAYELLYTDTPSAVVVNEAVELAKAYSDTQSYSFINGILASIISGDGKNEQL